MLPVYTLTIFLSAALLFFVQPMAAKMVLPLLGGGPAVWNTSMVFFQALLLAGYLYSHLVTRRMAPARQVLIHAVVLILPLVGAAALGRLPVLDPRTFSAPGNACPALWLLGALALAVGGPFFVLSTTGPLMQRWFAATSHKDAKDPYFLYAASNIGSMLALIGYPLFMERLLRLQEQRVWFSAGYAAFVALGLACGVLMLRARPAQPVTRQQRRRLHGKDEAPQSDVPALPASISWPTRLWWIALAAVPSSLMLGVTQHIASDIASVPLLWVIPLAVYLVTFIIAFGRREIPIKRLSVLYFVLAACLALMTLARMRTPFWAVVGAHMLTFFAGALACHSRLARSRPDVSGLTEFYLLIALGGVIGGSFNALLAPVIFNGVGEYPIAIVAACLLAASSFGDPRPGMPAPALPLKAAAWEIAWFVLASLAWGVVFGWALLGGVPGQSQFWPVFTIAAAALGAYCLWRARVRPVALDLLAPLATILTYIGLQYAFRQTAPIGGWTAAVAVGIAAGLLGLRLAVPGAIPSRAADVLVPAIIALSDVAVRRIVLEAGVGEGGVRSIVWYGLTALLLLLSLGRRLRIALAIAAVMMVVYFRSGAVGKQVFASRTFFGVHRILEDSRGRWRMLSHGTTPHGIQSTDPRIAMRPTMYYHPTGPIGQVFGWRANDPQFDRVAIVGLGTGGLAAYGQPHQTFTYYEIDPEVIWIARDSGYFTFLQRTGAKVDIVAGDGRIEVAKAPPKAYDLIIIDAFSSDSIPVHLITKEAVKIYFDKLADRGVIAFNVSNRYLELRPPLGAIAMDAGWVAMHWDDDRISDMERAQGKLKTTWVFLARSRADFRGLDREAGWSFFDVTPEAPRWTDDYSNILSTLMRN